MRRLLRRLAAFRRWRYAHALRLCRQGDPAGQYFLEQQLSAGA